MNGPPPTITFCDKIKRAYVNHFPTDKQSSDVTFPTVGLVVSFLCMFVITSQECHIYQNVWFKMAFLLAATSVSIQLFWGFHIGDRKQFTPWILFKMAENTCTVVLVGFSFPDQTLPLSVEIVGILCIVLSSLMTLKIALLSKQMQQKFSGVAQY